MNPEERDELVRETHQAVLGIKGTDDKGMVGDIKEIKAHLDNHSSRLTIVEVKQEERNKPSKKSIAGYASGIAAIAVALWKAFSGS